MTSKKNETKLNDFGFEDFANFDFACETTVGKGKVVDAWGGSLDSVNNNVEKIKKFKEEEVKRINKLDYSDNFDKDLEQVLKRSVMEQ